MLDDVNVFCVDEINKVVMRVNVVFVVDVDVCFFDVFVDVRSANDFVVASFGVIKDYVGVFVLVLM